MTISEARKILGKLSVNMTDEQVFSEIESATLLKELFFKLYLERVKSKSKIKWKKEL